MSPPLELSYIATPKSLLRHFERKQESFLRIPSILETRKWHKPGHRAQICSVLHLHGHSPDSVVWSGMRLRDCPYWPESTGPSHPSSTSVAPISQVSSEG